MSAPDINRFVSDPVVSMVGIAVVMQHGKLVWAGSGQTIPRGVLELPGEPVQIHLNPATYDRLAASLKAADPDAPTLPNEADDDPKTT